MAIVNPPDEKLVIAITVYWQRSVQEAERKTEIAYLCAEGMSIEQIAFWQGRIRI